MKLFIYIYLLLTSIPFALSAQDRGAKGFIEDSPSLCVAKLYRQKEDVYARYGYTFVSDSSKAYYSQFDWYNPMQRNEFIRLTESDAVLVEQLNTDIEKLLVEQSFLPEGVMSLTKDELVDRFPRQVRRGIGMTAYTIKYVFPFEDKTGENHLILGESSYNNYPKAEDLPIFNDAIKAVVCKQENRFLFRRAEIEDKIGLKGDLFDIRFIPRYTSTDDIDGDGFADPVFVYASCGLKGSLEGLVKVYLLYKDQMLSIEIQNDFETKDTFINTSIGIGLLPQAVQLRLKRVIEGMEVDGFCVLEDDWLDIF